MALKRAGLALGRGRKWVLAALCGLAFGVPAKELCAQSGVTASGRVVDGADQSAVAYATLALLSVVDSHLVVGTISDDLGRFELTGIAPGDYRLVASFVGYTEVATPVFVGERATFLDLGTVVLAASAEALEEVTVTANREAVSGKLDRKTYGLDDILAQRGGSALQAMQTLPGVTVRDGTVELRGSSQVMILVDGKASALTGIGKQSGLDNLPASAIERIEVINNPSARYDAQGNAGIINIILRKDSQEGLHGRVGLTGGLGSLWERRANLPSLGPQYRATPKINPTASANLRQGRSNLFAQADYLYTETLNKNEFVTRRYDDGRQVRQQTVRNRDTHFFVGKAGADIEVTPRDKLSVSGNVGTESIIDRGQEHFFDVTLADRRRQWNFLEDELKTTLAGNAALTHDFAQAGHRVGVTANYTFHREDERYTFDDASATRQGRDAFKLLSDEQVTDLGLQYNRPLRSGGLEARLAYRYRVIPTNMQFFPGVDSPIDASAGGAATYREHIPAAFVSYLYETRRFDAEVGVRAELVDLRYSVDPDHPTYRSDGYRYAQPFPNVRVGYRLNDNHKVTAFFNRRVDRPAEVEIRIFPKYDDAEIIKVGNPQLKPQFTTLAEFGYKGSWDRGYVYASAFHRASQNTITRIASAPLGDGIIYNVFQNAGNSAVTGLELLLSQKLSPRYKIQLNGQAYRQTIAAFSVVNLYPVRNGVSAAAKSIESGNVKLVNDLTLAGGISAQVTAVFLGADLVPQGKTSARFTLDLGANAPLWGGRGAVTLTASDLLGTLVTHSSFTGVGFRYVSDNYAETQVVKLGVSYKL